MGDQSPICLEGRVPAHPVDSGRWNGWMDAEMKRVGQDKTTGKKATLCQHGGGGTAYLVEVVEGCPELLHLLLADALGVSGKDLVFHLIDGAGNGGEQLLPAHADVLGASDELVRPRLRAAQLFLLPKGWRDGSGD